MSQLNEDLVVDETIESNPETDSPEVVEVSEDELSKEEQYRRGEQRALDRFHALEKKFDTVLEQNSKLMSQLQTNVPVSAPEIDETEQYIQQEWQGDKVLTEFNQRLKQIEQENLQLKSKLKQDVGQQIYTKLDTFCGEQKAVLSNPDVGARFVEELNDRLGTYTIHDIMNGTIQDEAFAKTLDGKIKRAYEAATAKKVDVQRAVEATERMNNRANKPTGTPPSSTVAPALSYKDIRNSLR